jgi:membrane-bound ClpP family serine protease
MSDSIIDKKKDHKNKMLGFVLIFAGMIIFISRIFLGNSLIVTIIGALIIIIGLTFLKK